MKIRSFAAMDAAVFVEGRDNMPGNAMARAAAGATQTIFMDVVDAIEAHDGTDAIEIIPYEGFGLAATGDGPALLVSDEAKIGGEGSG